MNTIPLLLLILTVTAHDLLFFDEFEFKFNLLDSNDWDEYELNNDYSNNRRRLSFSTNTDHAIKCTNVIPVLFKKLCVQWDARNGFSYNYAAPQPTASHLSDTNWFYSNRDDKISSATAAGKYYGDLLSQNDIYLGDDAAWNEINYANQLSSFSLSDEGSHNHFLKNFAKGSFKQCRHSAMMSECTQFHLPSKTLTVKIKTAKYRKQPSEENEGVAARQIPANLADIDGANANVMEDNYINNEYYQDDGYYDDDDGYYQDEEEDEDYYEDYYDEYYDDEYYDDYDGDDYDEYYQEEEDYDDAYYDDGFEELFEDVAAYDFEHEFEYGDARGYHNWAADRMRWDAFDCINCDERARKRLIDLELGSLYDLYGDYTYLFHDHALDFSNDNDWNEITKEGGMKCSIAIPGLAHKLCVDLSKDKDDATISFAAADDDDIDYGYYDMYGYDMYYYNMDHLYGHGAHPEKHSDAQLQEIDIDTDTDTDDGYDNYEDDDTDYYHFNQNKDTDQDVDKDGNVKDSNNYGDDDYNFDYYHTRSDNDNDDNNNQDYDDNTRGSDGRNEPQRDAYDADGDENAQRYSDRYKTWKDAQNEQQDDNELAYLNAQQNMGINNPYNMMNPLQQLQQQMTYGQTRRRLRFGAEQYYENSNDVAAGQDYFDEDFYENIIDTQQQQMDIFNQAFMNSVREELSDAVLQFQNDELWDDITHINDASHSRHIRKCASFQILELCATTEPTHKNLKLNVKIGKHKFHRAYRPWEQPADAMKDISDIYSDNDRKSTQNMNKMSNLDETAMADTDRDTWGIDAGIIDVDDADWNNEELWSSSTQIPTSNKLKKQIIRKCKSRTFCLCQFKDISFDAGQKHKCVSYKHHNLQPQYQLLNVMDEFFSSPKISKLIHGLHNAPNRIHGPGGDKVPRIKFEYHPSIVHLHIMGRYPFFSHKHHLHRYKVPWFKYKKYQQLRPNERPRWCPRWIWRELLGHLKRPQGLRQKAATKEKSNLKQSAAARFDEFDYYDYDGAMVDSMDAMEDYDDIDEELPFVQPIVGAAIHLLPNVLSNANKILPKVLRRSVGKGGDIYNALGSRGGAMHYGSGGYKLESFKKAVRGKGNVLGRLFRSRKHNKLREKYLATHGMRRRMKEMRRNDDEYYYDSDDDGYYDDEGYYADDDDDYYDEDYYDDDYNDDFYDDEDYYDDEDVNGWRNMAQQKLQNIVRKRMNGNGLNTMNANNGLLKQPSFNGGGLYGLTNAFRRIRAREKGSMARYDRNREMLRISGLNQRRRMVHNYDDYDYEDEDEANNEHYDIDDDDEYYDDGAEVDDGYGEYGEYYEDLDDDEYYDLDEDETYDFYDGEYGEDYDDLYDEDDEQYGDYYDDEIDADYDDINELYDEVTQEEYEEATFEDLIDELYDDITQNVAANDDQYDAYNDQEYEEYDDVINELYDELYDDELSAYYDDEGDIVDDWYDAETAMNWVITNDDINEDSLTQFISEIIKSNIVTSSGNKIQRKCMNLFGKKICICQFLEFIDAKPASLVCHPQKQKPKAYKNPINAKPHKKTTMQRLKRVVARKKLQKIKTAIKKKTPMAAPAKAKLSKLKARIMLKRKRKARLKKIKKRIIARRKYKKKKLKTGSVQKKIKTAKLQKNLIHSQQKQATIQKHDVTKKKLAILNTKLHKKSAQNVGKMGKYTALKGKPDIVRDRERDKGYYNPAERVYGLNKETRKFAKNVAKMNEVMSTGKSDLDKVLKREREKGYVSGAPQTARKPQLKPHKKAHYTPLEYGKMNKNPTTEKQKLRTVKQAEKKKLAVLKQKISANKRVQRHIKKQEKKADKPKKHIYKKPARKLDLINGKPLGPMMIRKIERANKLRQANIRKKRIAKLKTREVLKQAQKNILRAKARKIRKDIRRQLPGKRPLWLPHYFWHWLNKAPHFHALRHKNRIPWTPQGVDKEYRAAHEGEQDVIDGFVSAVGQRVRGNAAHYLAEEVFDEYAYDGYESDEDGYDEYEDVEDGFDWYDEGNYDDVYDEYESDEDVDDGFSDYYGGEEDAYDGLDAFEDDGYDEYDDDEYYDGEEVYDGFDWYEDDGGDYADNDEVYDEYESNGWNDEYDDGYEVDGDNNYLENGNDFSAVNGDSGEYGGFLWLIAFLSFAIFCVVAFFVSIGMRRRRRKLKRIERQNIYLQQALEMSESESESESETGSDQQMIE